MNTSVELNDQRSEVLNSVKSTLNLINDSMKTMSSVTPLFKELIQSMTDLLNYEHINKSVSYYYFIYHCLKLNKIYEIV